MAFGAFGYVMPQTWFVQGKYGAMIDGAGSNEDILHALNGVYVDLHGKRFYAVGEAASHGTIGVNQMIHDLAFDCPMIVCYSTGGAIGHATLLTSITYTGPWGARASRSGVAAHLAAVGRGAAVLELGGSLAGDFGHVVGSYACEPGQPGSAGPCRGYMRAPMMGTAVSSTVTP